MSDQSRNLFPSYKESSVSSFSWFGLSSRGVLETLLLALFILVVYRRLIGRNKRKDGRIEVPEVGGWWPIIGHMVQLGKDPHGFLEDCYRKYGKVFTIRIGRRKVAFLCDRDLLQEYFSADENQLSFYKFMESTNFNASFSDTISNPIAVAKPFIKKAFVSRMTEFLVDADEHIGQALQVLVESQSKGGEILDMRDMLKGSFEAAIFKTLYKFDITPQFLSVYEDFCLKFQTAALASYVLPQPIVELFLLRRVRSVRDEFIQLLLPVVRKYMDDEYENTSTLIRQCVDNKHESLGGRKFTEREICLSLLNLHFAMVSTPSSLCAHVIRELSTRPDLWIRIREELDPGKVTTADIIKNQTLNVVVMETARLNSNIALLSRVTHPHSTLGKYYVGNVDNVSVPGPLLLEREPANDIFTNPKEFNPNRFLSEGGSNEPIGPTAIWLWGAGVHACPGRSLSINEIKIFIAHFVHHFDIKIVSKQPKNFMTANAIPLQEMKIQLFPVGYSNNNNNNNNNNNATYKPITN